MVRKTWCILFTLLFLAVIFVSCGTTPDNTTPDDTTPTVTTPADTTPVLNTPIPYGVSYSVNTTDEAIKVVAEKDYYKVVLLTEKGIGDWLIEKGAPYHERLLNALKDLGYFPAIGCFAEHEKHPESISENTGLIRFNPSEYSIPSISHHCNKGMLYELCPMRGKYDGITSVIDYFSVAYGASPEEKGWTQIQLMRGGKAVTAVQQIVKNEDGEYSNIRFVEDGLCVSIYGGNIAAAENVEIIKLPYPDEPIALEKDFLAQLRLEETTYEDICAWSGSEGTKIAPNVYEWQMGYRNAKTVRLYFMTSENGDAVLAGYRTSNALTDAPSVLTVDLFMSQIERGKTTYADLCTLAGEEGDFLEPLLCEWTLDGSRSQTVRVTLEAPSPEAPMKEWTVTDFTRLDGEKVILFEDFVNLVRNNTVTYRDVYEFMGRHGVMEWTNNYSWMIGENFSQKVFVSFDPAKEGESLYDRVEHGWGYD